MNRLWHPLAAVLGMILASYGWAEPGQTIHMNSQVVSAASHKTMAVVSRSGNVADLFREQQTMVKQILKDIGIPLAGLPPAVRKHLSTPPTQNFGSFVAYSMGIDLLDQGRYAEARAAFSRSAAMDPSFKQAVLMNKNTPLTRESLASMTERATRSASKHGSDILSGRPVTPPPPPPPPATGQPTGSFQEVFQQTVSEVQTISTGVSNMVESIGKNPDSAPDQLRMATKMGVSPGMALETALLVLDQPSSDLVEKVLGEAIQAGISVADAKQVASQLRARGGCR